MYDIEVIEGKSYAVIGEGTKPYEFLKSMNTRLTMKKLASDPGEQLYLTIAEMGAIPGAFKAHDFKRLIDIGLICYVKGSKDFWPSKDKFSFTEYGIEIVRDIKEFGGDIEIRL